MKDPGVPVVVGGVTVTRDGEAIVVGRIDDSRTNRSLHGLQRTLIANMVEGCAKGYVKQLEISGVGFKAFPCNYFTHRPIDAALMLREEYGIRPQDIERVEIRRPLFIVGFPRTGSTLLQRLLARDPAARSALEVLICYPGVHALGFYRVAHWLWGLGLTTLGRLAAGMKVNLEFDLIARYVERMATGV